MLELKLNHEWRARLAYNGMVLFFAFVGYVRFQFTPAEPTFIQKAVVELVAPMQRTVMNMKVSVKNFVDQYLDIVNTRRDNDFLRQHINELSQQVFALSSLKQENDRLKALLAFGEKVPHTKVLGQVVGWDVSTEYKILRIDKGSNDGITLKSAVITAEGLVGHTYRVYDNYSDILTILDANNRVDVVVDRTRIHGIIEGKSLMTCSMKYVPRTEPVLVKDILVTAGLSMVYPKGIKVGKVVQVKVSPESLTQDISVEPAVDFSKLEEVVVLVRPAGDQLILQMPIGSDKRE